MDPRTFRRLGRPAVAEGLAAEAESVVEGSALDPGRIDDVDEGSSSWHAAVIPSMLSRKRSGSPSGCGTQHVLKLIDRYPELLG